MDTHSQAVIPPYVDHNGSTTWATASRLATTDFSVEMLQLLRDGLNAFDTPRARLRSGGHAKEATHDHDSHGDVARIRSLMNEAALYGLPSQRMRRPRPTSNSINPQLVEHTLQARRTPKARIAIKTTRRRAARSKRLLEFQARLTYIPSVGSQSKSHALTLDLCQLTTPDGLLSLPPVISLNAVISADAEIFRLIDHDDIAGVQHLLHSGQASIRDCDEFGRTVLHRAAWNSIADLWAMLLTEGADVDCVTALSSSALLHCRGVDLQAKWRLALEAGADPTLLPGGQFYLATMGVDVVRSTLRISAPYIDLKLCNAEGRSLLLVCALAASNKDQPLILRLLLRAGADVHESDDEGNTSLHLLLKVMQPTQPHCMDSLATLLRAGATPLSRNHSGETAVDVTCTPLTGLGSFQSDALLEGLARTRCPVTDKRLLAPPVFTTKYTRDHHIRLHNASDCPEGALWDASTRLLNSLVGCTDCSSIVSQHRLHEAAVTRVTQSLHGHLAHSNEVFSIGLQYLRRMIEGKKTVVTMVKDRLPYQTWVNHSRGLDWLRITDEAETAALLEFDWFRHVDCEDLFVAWVDNVIMQLEDCRSRECDADADFDQLVEVMENAIPSHKELCQRGMDKQGPLERHTHRSATISLPRIVTQGTQTELQERPEHDVERHDSLSPEKRPRQISMVKTPSEFYGPVNTTDDLDSHSMPLADGIFALQDTQLCLAAGNIAREWRHGTKMAH